ncbi:MAG: hypothetical protein U0938_11975 [Thiobacillus sp.]|nr:hypothetical protein [Thiobacillus sp.]
MKNAPIQTANESAGETANSITSKFYGTDNPRHLRAIPALLTRSHPREHLDTVVGCSNSPELVAELRRRGLDVPCDRVPDFDRDGKPIRRGVYYFTKSDRRKIYAWLRQRNAKGHV